MEAVVLAGGYATRMWPITRHRPKMFLPVGDGTVIDGVFADLEADDRVEEVYVSTNERFADEFETYLAESGFEKPQVSVEDTTAESEKFGVVGALAQLIERENVDDDLLVVAGDNMLSFDLAEFVDFFETKEAVSLAAYDVGSRERAKSYGLVELDGTRVVDFQEKPDDPNSTLVSIGCYVFPQDSLPKFDTYLSNDNNPDEPGWLIQWFQDRQPVHAFSFDGAWFDIGTADSYLDAVAWELDGDTVVADDATVVDSELSENVYVMSGAEVTDSTLSNTVVFDDVTIDGSSLSDSVVDEAATVTDLDLSETLVGQHSRLHGE
ncbi:MAG: sugar phosphate nucleotidyltransferase [Halobaculum sp.]|jgi:glucose-1-phosphate thymidylyltransferase